MKSTIILLIIMVSFSTYLVSMALVYGDVFNFLRKWLRPRSRFLFMLLGCVMCTSTHVAYILSCIAMVICVWMGWFDMLIACVLWLPIGFTSAGISSIMYELGPARNNILQKNKCDEEDEDD
jgi:K+-transporting ATPase A subunit